MKKRIKEVREAVLIALNRARQERHMAAPHPNTNAAFIRELEFEILKYGQVCKLLDQIEAAELEVEASLHLKSHSQPRSSRSLIRRGAAPGFCRPAARAG